jgi:hypothetical protein
MLTYIFRILRALQESLQAISTQAGLHNDMSGHGWGFKVKTYFLDLTTFFSWMRNQFGFFLWRSKRLCKLLPHYDLDLPAVNVHGKLSASQFCRIIPVTDALPTLPCEDTPNQAFMCTLFYPSIVHSLAPFTSSSP